MKGKFDVNEKLKIAVIGAGRFSSEKHLPALARIDGIELAGLCDLNETRLSSVGEKFNITPSCRFSDYRRMLETVRPDAVYAIMPPHHIFDVAMEVMDRGCALFIEKPPGVSTVQTESMARMATRKKLVTAVAFQRRYHPLVRACWERVKAKNTIHRLRVSYHKNISSGEVHPYYRGAIDILRCDAIHAVDAARFYAGQSVVKDVRSVVRKIGMPYENCFQALVVFENGVVAAIDADWSSGRRFFKFEFHAPGACAYADIDGVGAVWEDNKAEPVFESTYEAIVGSSNIVDSGGFLAENQTFVDAVRSGHPPHNCLEDAAETMRLIDSIYKNAASM